MNERIRAKKKEKCLLCALNVFFFLLFVSTFWQFIHTYGVGKKLLINHCVISFADKFPKCQALKDNGENDILELNGHKYFFICHLSYKERKI